MTRVFVVIASAAVSTASAVAHADDGDGPRFTAAPSEGRLPAPFVLPELSHPRFDLGADWFVARLAAGGDRSGAVVGVVHPFFEASALAPRRIFVGATYPIAWALPPDGGLAPGEIGRPSGVRALLGNVEAHVRVVFPLPTSLESGFTLGVVVPTAPFDREDRASRSASEAAMAVDPTNYVHFLPERVALRPAGDLRLLRGPFVVQARHGIDVLIDDAGIEHAKIAGRLVGHVGYRVRSHAEMSLEASQVYFFSSDEKSTGEPTPAKAFADRYRVSDSRRSAITLGPALRLSYPDADVGVSVVTNVGDPLSPAATSFVGIRVSVIGHLGGAPAP
jgi:hypothetical protein